MQLNDRELLAKTLQAEAGNQGIGGMLAVGSVIRNRMQQGGSLSDVILAPAQFSAWNKVTGAVGGEQGQDMAALKPSKDAYAAADAILSGSAPDITGGATHYYNPSISNPAWGKEKAGGDWTKIGSHIFGKAGDFRTGAAKMNGNQKQQAQMAQPQQSQGLLGGLLGGQGIGGALGLSDDFRDRLKMGLLLGSDPRAFAPMVAGMQQAAKERRAMARTTAQANRTIEFLQQRGRDDLAQAVLTGAVDPSSAVQVAISQPKDTRTAAMREYEYAQRDPKFAEFLKLKEPPETPAGLKTLDTEFAKTLGSASGVQALAAARQDAATISKVLKELESGKELTGPVLGFMPENIRALINPEAVQAQQLVEGVVQKNLRAILGGQFAQKEGEQLVRRAYNPILPEEQNAARLRALFLSLQTAAENKAAMEDYFRKNNFSLRGYEGPMGIPTMAEFEAAMDAAAPAPSDGAISIGGYTIEEVKD